MTTAEKFLREKIPDYILVSPLDIMTIICLMEDFHSEALKERACRNCKNFSCEKWFACEFHNIEETNPDYQSCINHFEPIVNDAQEEEL